MNKSFKKRAVIFVLSLTIPMVIFANALRLENRMRREAAFCIEKKMPFTGRSIWSNNSTQDVLESLWRLSLDADQAVSHCAAREFGLFVFGESIVQSKLHLLPEDRESALMQFKSKKLQQETAGELSVTEVELLRKFEWVLKGPRSGEDERQKAPPNQ